VDDELVQVGEGRMLDSEEFRTRARELAERARCAPNDADKARLTGMARSFLLLAKNAEWIRSTDGFLQAIERNQRWPHPNSANELNPALDLKSLAQHAKSFGHS
jgi:hypothetical protein